MTRIDGPQNRSQGNLPGRSGDTDSAAGPVVAAGPADLDAIWPHLVGLHAHENVPVPGDAVRAALRTALSDPAVGRVLLARDGAGSVVAYLVLLHGFSLEYGGRVGLVDELFVRDDLRGQGIGARLLDAAEEHGRAAGLAALQLEVGDANPRAYDLYRRRGYRDHDRHLMTKRLASAGLPSA